MASVPRGLISRISHPSPSQSLPVCSFFFLQRFSSDAGFVEGIESDVTEIGCGNKKPKHLTMPVLGHFRAQGVALKKKLREFPVMEDALLPVVGLFVWLPPVLRLRLRPAANLVRFVDADDLRQRLRLDATFASDADKKQPLSISSSLHLKLSPSRASLHLKLFQALFVSHSLDLLGFCSSSKPDHLKLRSSQALSGGSSRALFSAKPLRALSVSDSPKLSLFSNDEDYGIINVLARAFALDVITYQALLSQAYTLKFTHSSSDPIKLRSSQVPYLLKFGSVVSSSDPLKLKLLLFSRFSRLKFRPSQNTLKLRTSQVQTLSRPSQVRLAPLAIIRLSRLKLTHSSSHPLKFRLSQVQTLSSSLPLKLWYQAHTFKLKPSQVLALNHLRLDT
ncbi:unnamed protein product [Eruca vesicaria subsp. sativa]|uniref:Uncharacterized protein n=1 Tax=Eruca vesicaria subsp. sativa TaxID=29727 RepID=A0ABC8L7D6_ERUVS|nr:unnamed protein product [Eruca vesicaria subsp. sativa]